MSVDCTTCPRRHNNKPIKYPDPPILNFTRSPMGYAGAVGAKMGRGDFWGREKYGNI